MKHNKAVEKLDWGLNSMKHQEYVLDVAKSLHNCLAHVWGKITAMQSSNQNRASTVNYQLSMQSAHSSVLFVCAVIFRVSGISGEIVCLLYDDDNAT